MCRTRWQPSNVFLAVSLDDSLEERAATSREPRHLRVPGGWPALGMKAAFTTRRMLPGSLCGKVEYITTYVLGADLLSGVHESVGMQGGVCWKTYPLSPTKWFPEEMRNGGGVGRKEWKNSSKEKKSPPHPPWKRVSYWQTWNSRICILEAQKS